MNLSYSLCPKFGEYQAEFWSSSVWYDHQNVTKTVLNDLSNVLNFPVGKDTSANMSHKPPHTHTLNHTQGRVT